MFKRGKLANVSIAEAQRLLIQFLLALFVIRSSLRNHFFVQKMSS